jgi:hypothetical protein
MSKRKKSKKNGSGDEEKDPKHPNNDPRTNVTQKQREKMKKLGVGNRKESTQAWNKKDSKSAKKRKAQKAAQKAKKELREQERRNEPVVEPGNEIQNEVLETVPEGENRVESPVLDLVDSPDLDKVVEYKSKPRQRLSSSSQVALTWIADAKLRERRARVALTMIMNEKLGARRARIANPVKARAALMTRKAMTNSLSFVKKLKRMK